MISKNIKKVALSSMMIGAMLSPVASKSFAVKSDLQVTAITGNKINETSNAVDKYMFEKVQNLYLVSESDYVDSLTGGVLVGENKGSLLFVKDHKVDEKAMARIKAADNVYIIGGENSVSSDVVKDVANYRGRIAGKDRYATGIEIAKALGEDRGVIIANSTDFPDSLSATALAVKSNMSIMLTEKDKLNDSVKEYIKDKSDKDIYFVGGEASLSKAVKEEIYETAGKDKAKVSEFTLAGKDRYETSLKVAEKFDANNNIVLTGGKNHKDAMLGIVVASNTDSPVVLANNFGDNASLKDYLKNKEIGKVNAITTNDNLPVETLREIIAAASNKQRDEIVINDHNGDAITMLSGSEEEEVTGTPFTGWVSSDVNVREGQSMQSRILGVLGKATKVTGESMNNGWVKIEYKGNTAYVGQKLLSTTEIKVEQPKEPVKQEENKNNNNNNNTDNNNSNNGLNYSKVLNMNATAYSPDPAENGGYSVTALGTPLRRGVVAVDRRVIPLGTKLYIEGYGYARAEDTGGAIKGNRIDLLFNTKAECRNFGRRTVKVYILK